MSAGPRLLGIVNITEDSFSDGGLYLAPAAAIRHAEALIGAGADIVDLGAASSNPDAVAVSPETEIARLDSVVAALRGAGHCVSIDSCAIETQRWALSQGVEFLNDIDGFAEPAFYPELAAASANLIVMHSVGPTGRSSRETTAPETVFDTVLRFFDGRLRALTSAGIAPRRLIVDPGMGFFLGSKPEASFAVLRRLADLKAAFGRPILVSVSRKSFLRHLVGRAPMEAGAATLAAELFAARHGVDYIRTHNPGALRDALCVQAALDGAAGRA